MHRYSAAGGGSGAGNNTASGVPKDTTRPDLGFSTPSTFSLTSRRLAALTPYRLKCDQEPLIARLGPPDFFPPTPNCPEESLSRDACQNGYKETIDGIEESRETNLTLANQSVWSKPLINKYKEAIRKRLKALNNALIRKRKAGQVYGVQLSGPWLAKSGQFPEQRHTGEDNRKKWIEDLAQHKRLKVLADHAPHGLRRRALFEALIKNEVPFLRATWYIKVTYLNQVRPLSIGMSAGGGDKSQSKRIDLWTKDVLEYMQFLLDELIQHGAAAFSSLGRDTSGILPVASSSQQGSDFTTVSLDGDDPSLPKKWHYMVRLVQLHYTEGLLLRTQVVEWLLKQLQEREALDASELLLPLVLDLIDEICTCQTLVRTLVDVSLQKLGEICPTGSLPEASEQPRQLYVSTFFAELLCYLLTAVPDIFVALDCFPLPPYIYSGRRSAFTAHPNKARLSADCIEETTSSLPGDQHPSNYQRAHYSAEVSIKHLADSIEKRAASLAKAVNPGILRKNEGKVIQTLDKALVTGNILAAYHCVFDEEFCGYEQPPDEWLAEVSPWLKLNHGLSGNPSLAEVFAVRFLCEWAICDFRDFRWMTNSPDHKNINPLFFCRVYMAVSVLCLRREEIEKQKARASNGATAGSIVAGGRLHMVGRSGQETGAKKGKVKNGGGHFELPLLEGHASYKATSLSSFFESPGPIHDVIVAWLDQRELRRGGGFERLQLLLWELVNKGLFWSPAYVRQLIVSGVLEKRETPADLERASRHRRLLQHLPGPPGFSADDDGKDSVDPVMIEAIRIYRNERRLALNGFDLLRPKTSRKQVDSVHEPLDQGFSKEALKNNDICTEPSDLRFSLKSLNTGDKVKRAQRKKMRVMELKHAIARCLHFPDSCVGEQVCSLLDKSTLWHANPKRQLMPHVDRIDATAGCEECGRSKKQKVNDGSSSFSQGLGMSCREEDDMWWVKKVPKTTDASKPEPAVAVKPPKQPSRGRPKAVRKLSLAQLAAARIESSQGASSSHSCDSKVQCPYHNSSVEGNMVSESKESKRVSITPDLKAAGNLLKRLRVGEKRTIATWLYDTVCNLTERGDKVASISTQSQHTVGYEVCTAADDRSSIRWKLGEEELAAVIYFLDVATDFQSLIKLLVFLLPKANISTGSPGQSNRFNTPVPWSKENCVCEVGEATILTCLRRYEDVLTASNFLPEVLSAGMHRAAMVMYVIPGGRVACLSLFSYIRDLYKKYSVLSSLQSWEKSWKACNDRRMIDELEALKAGEGEASFSLLGVSSPGVGDDRDDLAPPRSMGRLARIVKDVVYRGFHEVINQRVNKERELLMSSGPRATGLERWPEGFQAAQHVVTGLFDYIKQHSVSAPHSDAQFAAVAAAAVVSNAVSSVAYVFDSLNSNNSYSGSSSTGMGLSTKCAHQVLQAHIHCVRLLKEAFGDRQSRVLESVLAGEAITIVANAIGQTSGRAPRQFQLSPETPDPSSALVGELGAVSNGLALGKANTAKAAVAALVVGLVLEGIVGLEKLISVFKLKEGLEALQLVKNSCLNPNGMSRVVPSGNTVRSDIAEANLFWFSVLIGDCRFVACSLVAEILGESSLLAFMRMQRLLPFATVLIPAYALFSIALRGQQFSLLIGPNREDTFFHQVIFPALRDLLSHEPFREVCLHDTSALKGLLARDTGDFEYASLLDMKGADMYTKMSSLVPSRARLFLHAVLARKMPALPGDETYTQNLGNVKGHNSQVEELVQVLDDLQPATLHWQWLELRLLLNEQVFMEKLENVSAAAEAVQAATAAIEDGQGLSESEKNFTEIVLTRLLVRPDAAALYSEALYLLGRPMEEYLILQVQWILENSDMLLGRKSLRQQLQEMAQRKKFKSGCGRVKVWEWFPPQGEDGISSNDSDKKPEAASPEEGEVAEEGLDSTKQGKQPGSGIHDCGLLLKKHFAIEKALADLVLPCLKRSSSETCNRFASRLVKQMSDLEQQVSLLSRSSGRSMVPTSDAGVSKGLVSRKGPRSGLECGSPGLGRRSVASVADSSPPSAAALQTSLWVRLQFLLPLLPPIYTDREPASRNMRLTLAPVLLRLLGTRAVQESTDPSWSIQHECLVAGRDFEWNAEAAAAAAAAAAGEGLFDRILSVLHALLSSTRAVWLKQKSKTHREVPLSDRELVQRMQADLDHMLLPPAIRARLQAALPILSSSSSVTTSAGPPQIPAAAFSVLQTSLFSTSSLPTLTPVTASHKAPFRLESSVGKGKLPQDPDMELDPWTLLEDGTGSVSSGGGNGVITSESGIMKACAWLKGAVRVRRTDLTYVGSIDDDA